MGFWAWSVGTKAMGGESVGMVNWEGEEKVKEVKAVS